MREREFNAEISAHQEDPDKLIKENIIEIVGYTLYCEKMLRIRKKRE